MAKDFDEQKFRKWYLDWAKKSGISEDPDEPEHHYDYRAAYKAGIGPKIDPEDKKYHWSSKYKKDTHPNLIVNGKNTKTGKNASISELRRDKSLRG